MKSNPTSFLGFYKKHPKRFWVLGILITGIVAMSLFGSRSKESVTVLAVSRENLKTTILATGQVTSKTDLSLSFSTGDVVKSISVSVGDKVAKGRVLATLDNRDEYASLKSAEARYNKVAEGASTEEIAVAEAQLKTAKTDLENKEKLQDTLVDSAYRRLLNTDLTPTLSSGISSTPPSVSGTYTGKEEGVYKITARQVSSGSGYFIYSGIESGSGDLSVTSSRPLGSKGLFIQFPSDFSSDSVWTVSLPNTKSVNYVSNLNSYNEAVRSKESVLSSARALVSERESELALRKANARPADLEVAQADVLSASINYENTILRAPSSGTITKIDTKIGERAEAQKPVMVLQDVGNLYVEANINESNIAKIAINQKVEMTLDAFGPDVKLTGIVAHIDPSSTNTDGVANYKIKVSIDVGDKKNIIRPGMNANMTIIAWEKPQVIVMPKAGLSMENGKYFVRLITDEKHKKYENREVVIGESGDGNLIEIVSGISESDKIAIVSK